MNLYKEGQPEFSLLFVKESREQLKALKNNKSRQAEYKATIKTLQFLKTNPRHNSLNSHQYYSRRGPNGEKVFESYAQAKRPNPYRVFWFYGPTGRAITVLSIVPHP